MDLFSKDPSNADYDANSLDRETAQPYSQKFWDAGNQIVLLAYGAAFGTYLILAQYDKLRNPAIDHKIALIALALLGNAALMYLLWRMACHEYRLTRTYTKNPVLIDAIWSALHMRLVLVAVNLLIYVFVLTVILKPV